MANFFSPNYSSKLVIMQLSSRKQPIEYSEFKIRIRTGFFVLEKNSHGNHSVLPFYQPSICYSQVGKLLHTIYSSTDPLCLAVEAEHMVIAFF